MRDDGPPEGAKLKAMVQSGSVTWDVLDTDLPAIQTMVKDGLLDPIDYSKLDKAKLDKIPKPLHNSHGIGHKIYSFNIVYNTKTFPTGKHPRSWAEVWDGQKFKGGRSFNFRGGIAPQLEIALLADGVAMDKLYPIDIERAWKSMDRLRPLVTKWYQSHAEAIQLADGRRGRHRVHRRPARHHREALRRAHRRRLQPGQARVRLLVPRQGIEEPGGRAAVHQLRPRREAPGGDGEGESLRARATRTPSTSSPPPRRRT